MHSPNDLKSESCKQILVVDDEEAIVRLIRNMLRTQGLEVTGATNPAEALKLFTAWPSYWDLVLTDMLMPGMTGLQLAEKILSIRPDLPIILCSGYSIVSEEEALKAGIYKYMNKPFDFAELKCLIQKALSEKR